MGSFGKGSKLISPMLSGSKNIFIGNNVYVRKNTWLAAEPVTGDNNCKLIIGNGTYIGNFCHFYASSRIEIGEKVLFADRVYLSDNLHTFDDTRVPIIDQPIKQISPVIIGNGAWLGENVCVIGATIGKNSVVGANSVVTKNIPDYCVAVGAPAKIIKRFNFDNNQWQKTDELGKIL
jgi:acetyltransferase-like isoleucine patch superfamily enzyme